MELRNLVSGEVQSVDVSETIFGAAQQMSSGSVGALAVLEDADVVGIFTERDLVRAVAASIDAQSEPVRNWMTPYPDMLGADSEVRDAADWMLASGYRHIPVVDESGLVGMASIKDVLWAVAEES